MTVSLESTYTVPVPGTRKKRALKYCRSSVESAVRRSPLTVSNHLERNRVSAENRPVGSVNDASISPVSSLTTKVFPSRILTSSPLMTSPLPQFAEPARGHPGGREICAGRTPASRDHPRASSVRGEMPPSYSHDR